MSPDEFQIGVNMMYSRWGQKAYPEQVIARVWHHCQTLPYKSFERMVLTLMDLSRAAPMPREFQLMANTERDRLGLRGKGESESVPSAQAKCWDCADSGNLFAHHKTKNYEGVFRCHCEVGRRRPNAQGAIWTEQYNAWWTKLPAYAKGIGNWRPTKDQTLMDSVRLLMGTQVKVKRTSELKPAIVIIDSESET